MKTEAGVAARSGDRALLLHRVVDPGAREALTARLGELTAQDRPKFPGPNPVSVDTGDLPLRGHYYVCEKTDGVRYALMSTKIDVDGAPRNVVAIADRALAWFLLPLGAWPRAGFQGTVLDGELAWNRARGGWDYVVFDAVCVSGIPLDRLPLVERMRGAHALVRAYRAAPRDPARVTVKGFYRDPGVYRAALPRLRAAYDVDGVILTPAADAVRRGRHPRLFKLKEHHTVDFLHAGDGRLCVYDPHSRTHVEVARLDDGAPPDALAGGEILECQFLGGGGGASGGEATGGGEAAAPPRWRFVGVRVDKATANDTTTYEKTLLNAREALTLDDVVAAGWA